MITYSLGIEKECSKQFVVEDLLILCYFAKIMTKLLFYKKTVFLTFVRNKKTYLIKVFFLMSLIQL